MTIDLTQIILAIITLIGGLIARYLIPWIKEKLDERQYSVFYSLVKIGVYAAKQIFTADQWKEKKQYVVDLLKDNGYEVDSMVVDALIESTVKELKIELQKELLSKHKNTALPAWRAVLFLCKFAWHAAMGQRLTDLARPARAGLRTSYPPS